MGTGIAFALKYQNKKNVCFTMYGDGSANQGQLFEASNMAGLWSLPVVYVIENNHFGMGTPVKKASYYHKLYAKFRGIPGMNVDGMNVFALREATKFCKNFVLENGPIFLEIDTYRYQGHSMSDPGITYRTKEEVTQVRTERDCIDFVRHFIINNNIATEEELKKIEKEVRNSIEDNVEKIKKDPYPDPSELYTYLYVNEKPFVRGIEYQTSVFNDEHKI
jgi:pyruvate dehydrogenase E1 component alpha subunit